MSRHLERDDEAGIAHARSPAAGRGVGRQPGGASSKPSNRKPGATVQPTSVQAPRLVAVCHQPAGTTSCGRCPAREIGAETVGRGVVPVRRHGQHERRARVEMPDLGGVDPVPFRHVADAEEVVDRRRGRAPRAVPALVPERLAVEAALRMGLEVEPADDLVGAEADGSHQIRTGSSIRAGPGTPRAAAAPSRSDRAGEGRLAGAQERVRGLLGAEPSTGPGSGPAPWPPRPRRRATSGPRSSGSAASAKRAFEST